NHRRSQHLALDASLMPVLVSAARTPFFRTRSSRRKMTGVSTATRSARSRLLRRSLRHRQVPEGQLELPGIESGAGLGPVPGRQLEVAVLGPVHEHAEQVTEVGLGVERVELAGPDEREEVGRGLGVVVAADEEPRLPADRDGTQRSLRGVVLQAQPPVVEEAPERALLPDSVPERRAEQPARVLDLGVLGLGPREERVQERTALQVAERLAPRRRFVLPRLLELEELVDSPQPLARDPVLSDRGLVKLAPGVAPATDLVAELVVVGGADWVGLAEEY